ncbi:hypothetical protein [Streptomyces niveus]|uniref:hypothetical protein n=1 Tax=Streptomyces niveus TaxID=193462 RepID=UPI0036D2A51B
MSVDPFGNGLAVGTATIADGLGSPSSLTWAANSRLLDTVVAVTDRDITTAMAFAFTFE